MIAGVVSNSHHGVQVSGLKRAIVKMPAVVGTRGFWENGTAMRHMLCHDMTTRCQRHFVLDLPISHVDIVEYSRILQPSR